jgi:hypothetical protein
MPHRPDGEEVAARVSPTSIWPVSAGVFEAKLINPALDPGQVLAEVHRTAHVSDNHVSVFIKGQHFHASVHEEARRGNHYAFVLSVDSISHQGVIYRVCSPDIVSYLPAVRHRLPSCYVPRCFD